jgi:hypothetical protein
MASTQKEAGVIRQLSVLSMSLRTPSALLEMFPQLSLWLLAFLIFASTLRPRLDRLSDLPLYIHEMRIS